LQKLIKVIKLLGKGIFKTHDNRVSLVKAAAMIIEAYVTNLDEPVGTHYNYRSYAVGVSENRGADK